MTTQHTTYESSLATDHTNLQFAGFTGNVAAAPSFSLLQYPSLNAIEAAYANGTITQAQRVYYKNQTNMACQVADRTAKDTLHDAAVGDSLWPA